MMPRCWVLIDRLEFIWWNLFHTFDHFFFFSTIHGNLLTDGQQWRSRFQELWKEWLHGLLILMKRRPAHEGGAKRVKSARFYDWRNEWKEEGLWKVKTLPRITICAEYIWFKLIRSIIALSRIYMLFPGHTKNKSFMKTIGSLKKGNSPYLEPLSANRIPCLLTLLQYDFFPPIGSRISDLSANRIAYMYLRAVSNIVSS